MWLSVEEFWVAVREFEEKFESFNLKIVERYVKSMR